MEAGAGMKLLWMEIENFKGISHFRLELGGKSATVYGANATGKTTLADAFTWLLLGKDAQGRADFAVKPLGPDGQPLARGVETSVRAALETEAGTTTTLRRAYSEKWERRRGNVQAEMTGHTTAFEVDGLPCKASDYKAAVERLCPPVMLQALALPEFFCAVLPWQERRRVLAQMAGAISEEEILKAHPELRPLAAARGAHSVEDYKRIQERQRAALSKELDGLPARIDEASRAEIPLEGDPAQARAEEARLRGERQALSDALARGRDGALEAVERALAEKRAEIAELTTVNARRKADKRAQQEAEWAQRRKPLQARTNAAYAEVARLHGTRSMAEAEARRQDAACEALRRDYARVAGEAWQGALACPTCKRPYAPEDVQQARAAFAAAQKERLQRIAAQGVELAHAAAEARERARKLQEELTRAEEERDAAEAALAALETPPEIPDCPGYAAGLAALQDEQRALEARAEALRRDRAAAEGETRARLDELDASLRDCASLLAREAANERARARVQELLQRQKEIASELETAEGRIALCEAYVRAVASLTEARVDGQFRRIRWQLFEEQINGGLAETCVATVDGVPFADLNRAMRTNAGLDAIAALGRFWGRRAPVIVDSAEGVTALDRIPGQRIRLAVSAADETLRTEIEEE